MSVLQCSRNALLYLLCLFIKPRKNNDLKEKLREPVLLPRPVGPHIPAPSTNTTHPSCVAITKQQVKLFQLKLSSIPQIILIYPAFYLVLIYFARLYSSELCTCVCVLGRWNKLGGWNLCVWGGVCMFTCMSVCLCWESGFFLRLLMHVEPPHVEVCIYVCK